MTQDEGPATHKDLPVMRFGSVADFGAWLAEHHDVSTGAWLKLAKKGVEPRTVSYSEAVDIALCYGWIDSQAARWDERHYLQRFTPRKSRSVWSKVNREKIEKLLADGRVRPAGMRQVEAAKADGRWDAAYDPQSAATVPEDLQTALDANPKASEFFDTLTRQNRFAVIYRVHNAKRPETRARRIEQFVAMLAERKKIY
ncbi:MAG: hypothetical protein GEU94_19645 [Micromonosporaceae bacterium]|nr:hypothetical protein [Micromonosporaceae bacterium]